VNWTWSIRSSDGGMNGLEFCKALTAGGHRRVLVHAAPRTLEVEVREDGRLVAEGSAERDGDYTPITEVVLTDGGSVERREVWPDGSFVGLPVLLCGGEVGILQAWHHSDDRDWWRWSIELSNHRGRPEDWAPPAS
jgi:hypothetical protein